jgi:trigger factor
MQVSVESPTKVVRRLTVVVTAQQVEQAFDSQLAVFAKKAEIKGFRRGKVPLNIIKQRFAQEVRSETIHNLIQSTLNDAIRQEKLQPISTPRIETKQAEPGNSLEYIATFDVLPEVGEVNFKLDSLEKLTATVTEQDVDSTIERLREQHVHWNTVARAAHEKDKINAKIQMFLEAGVPLTPQSMPLEFVLKDEPSVFGWNLKEKLEGAQAGDEKRFSHTLPQDSFLQGMAGKTLEFKIEIVTVAEAQLPAIDSDFVKKLGMESGELQELRSEIHKQLDLNLKRSVKSLLREQVFEQLLQQNPLEIPVSLIEREAKHLHDENCSMTQQGQHKHKPEDEAYFMEMAKKRIQLGLVVGEFATKNKLSPSPQRIDEHITELASVYTDSSQYIRQIKSDKRALKEIESAVLEDQVVEKLLENVSIDEKKLSYEELIKFQKGA